MSSLPESVLYLKMDASSGVINLQHAMPSQRLILKKANVIWASTADSATAGSHINVNLDFFSHSRINSNRTKFINALPIFNDTKAASTIISLDIPIDTDSQIKQSFPYGIYTDAGDLVTNLTSVDLIFSYSDGAVL